MCKYALRSIAFFLLMPVITKAQKVVEPVPMSQEWGRPYQPFRIAGNLYYVGTYELACYLIVTNKGNILINTGLAASAAQIKANIELLGFKLADIRVLLTTQAHYDHLGAMADIKKQTSARFMVNEKDAAVVADGGKSDYAFGDTVSSFAPIIIDRLLKHKDTIVLGDIKLEMLHHPGHTKGSCSYLFSVKDSKRSYKVLIANMPTIVTDKSFDELTSYQNISRDYRYTLKDMKKLSFDIWLASHASQFKLHQKHKEGNPYDPTIFFDRKGYDESLSALQKDYDEKVK